MCKSIQTITNIFQADRNAACESMFESKRGPLLKATSDEQWAEVATFYGIVDDAMEAVAAKVETFPREAFVQGASTNTSTMLCLASAGLREIGPMLGLRAAGRAIFWRADAGRESSGGTVWDKWPEEACQWRPAAEAVAWLSRFCSRRVLHVSLASMAQFLRLREANAADLGADDAWPSGSLIISATAQLPAGSPEIVVVALLHAGKVRCCLRSGVVRHLLASIDVATSRTQTKEASMCLGEQCYFEGVQEAVTRLSASKPTNLKSRSRNEKLALRLGLRLTAVSLVPKLCLGLRTANVIRLRSRGLWATWPGQYRCQTTQVAETLRAHSGYTESMACRGCGLRRVGRSGVGHLYSHRFQR